MGIKHTRYLKRFGRISKHLCREENMMNKKDTVAKINKALLAEKKKNPTQFAKKNKTSKSDPYPGGPNKKGGK